MDPVHQRMARRLAAILATDVVKHSSLMARLSRGTLEADRQAREFFNQALALDPSYDRLVHKASSRNSF